MMKTKLELLERVIFKFTSGRFIFTIVVAGVFAHMACTGLLPPDKVDSVILVVLYAYFTKKNKIP